MTSVNDGTSFEDTLLPGHRISNNGYRFEMQTDGNLVLYNQSGLRKNDNTSINGKGEVWIAYKRFAQC